MILLSRNHYFGQIKILWFNENLPIFLIDRSISNKIGYGNHLRDYHQRWSHAARIDPRKSRNQEKGRGSKKERRILPYRPFPSSSISRWTFPAVTVHGYWLLLVTSSFLMGTAPIISAFISFWSPFHDSHPPSGKVGRINDKLSTNRSFLGWFSLSLR